MTDQESIIQSMFDACTSCCGDVAEDEACERCRLMARASKMLAGQKDRIATLAADLDVAESRQAEAFHRLYRERNEAHAAFLRCAQAIGVSYEADGVASAPGPIEEVERAIVEARRNAGEAIELRAKVQWFVDHASDEKLDGYRELGARAAAAENECDRWRARFAAAVIDGDRMRGALHDLAFAAPIAGDEHRNAKGWLSPEAWGAYVSRVQKMAGGAIRRPPSDALSASKHECPQCGKQSRDTTAGCDHCDLDDK